MDNNKNNNFKQKMNAEFGSDTDVNQVKQQVQQAEAKKQQASGSFKNFANQSSSAMNAEFGSDTDVNQVKQQIQQAEAKKQQASGIFSKNRYQNDNN